MKGYSLRQSIDKCFSPSQRGRIRVTRFRHGETGGQSGVIVRLPGATEAIEVLFFRHDDGAWRLFPAATRRPTMSVSRWAVS